MLKQKILAWLTREERMRKYPFLRRFFWKRGPLYRRLEQMAARVRQKEVITVAFMVLDLPCWKCDSVFRLMQQHPRFRPIIWIVPEPQIKSEEERRRTLADMRTYFAARQYCVAELYTLEQMRAAFAPDIVFLAKGSVIATDYDAWMMTQELVCYVPYCFQNSTGMDFVYGQENQVWRNFYTTPAIRKLAESVMANGGCNVAVTGSPVADLYLPLAEVPAKPVWRPCSEGMKRIIWAPHWSVGEVSWFAVATFLDVAEGMLHLAEKYVDRVQWAFKPHPLLRDTLYRHPDWGKERTDAYYEAWAALPNAQLETGAYVELFKQSDAMVHDSGSFIMEYLLVNKPCLYLQRSGGFQDFNEDTLRALECYRKGQTLQDVEAFILDLLSDNPDALADRRSRYRQKYLLPPSGRTSAELIVSEILKDR